MSFIFELIRKFVDTMLELFSFGRKRISNKLPVFIKTNTGKQLSLNLDPEWNISNVKRLVAPQLGISPTEVKIIFAGKELEDSTTIGVSSSIIKPLINPIN